MGDGSYFGKMKPWPWLAFLCYSWAKNTSNKIQQYPNKFQSMGLDIQIGDLGVENEHFKRRLTKCVFFSWIATPAEIRRWMHWAAGPLKHSSSVWIQKGAGHHEYRFCRLENSADKIISVTHSSCHQCTKTLGNSAGTLVRAATLAILSMTGK